MENQNFAADAASAISDATEATPLDPSIQRFGVSRFMVRKSCLDLEPEVQKGACNALEETNSRAVLEHASRLNAQILESVTTRTVRTALFYELNPDCDLPALETTFVITVKLPSAPAENHLDSSESQTSAVVA